MIQTLDSWTWLPIGISWEVKPKKRQKLILEITARDLISTRVVQAKELWKTLHVNLTYSTVWESSKRGKTCEHTREKPRAIRSGGAWDAGPLVKKWGTHATKRRWGAGMMLECRQERTQLRVGPRTASLAHAGLCYPGRSIKERTHGGHPVPRFVKKVVARTGRKGRIILCY